jgi:hypothetical protein
MKTAAFLTVGIVFVVAVLSTTPSSGQRTKPPAVAIEPVAAILDAFRSYSIVALGEGPHNNEQAHAFRLSLIRNPAFAMTVNDIVVEFGNSRYQDVMDRFVQGGNVPDNLLRQVWQNAAYGVVWDVSIYEEFFRAVRGVNASLSRERQLRVLLGDPPIDWDSSRSIQDQIRDFGTRDAFPLGIVQREVLAKHRRALLIWGNRHFSRKPQDSEHSLVALVESLGAQVFAIETAGDEADLEELQPSISKWPVPSLALIRGTTLELAPFKSSPYPATTVEAGDERFDALLYLGHPLTITYARFTDQLCGDAEYTRMRSRHSGDPAFATRFKALCRSPLPVLPQLWRTYRTKGIAATLASAPSTSASYAGGVSDLYRLAQAMMKRRKFDDAIAILELNAKIFPRDVLSLNTLAEAYAAKGDVASSWRSSRRTLAINRNDRTARHALGLDR